MAEFNIEVEDLLNLKTHLHDINLNYSNNNNNQQEGIVKGFGPANDDGQNIMEKQRLSAIADQCFSMMTLDNGIQIPSYDHHHHHHQFLSQHMFPPMEAGTSHHVAAAQPYPLKSYGRRKRKRNNNNNDKREGDHGKAKEVVHVRAKRGQATDSHSLAERQRREKINEKLKSLQGLVPGCYKTMGMAVMLDVIINYIRSLQNQIDFLSMKLSAASLFYDFNSSEMDAVDLVHQGTSLYEAQEMGKAVFEGYGAFPPQFQMPNWPL